MRSVIEEIAQAEQRAEDIRTAAAADARESIQKAREDAQLALARMEEQAYDTAQRELEAARIEGERLSAEIRQRMEREANELCARANTRLKQAISYLVDKVSKTA